MLRNILNFETPYIDTQALHELLREYRNPKDAIFRLVKSGELIRLKNGFFLIQEQINKGSVPFEQIANLLYGPSYLSLESALSFYGLIPEASYVQTSITTKPRRTFTTPVGTFSYHHLSLARYSVGVSHKKNALGGFSIATPEKALADHVFRLCQGLNSRELFTELTESMRMEASALKTFNKSLMQEIAEAYHSKIVNTLTHLIISL